MIHSLQAEKATTNTISGVSATTVRGPGATLGRRSLPGLGRIAEMLGVSRSGY